ncbi:septum formation protein Maf [Alicyclobacillus sp. TC]|uniref:Maf family protein n=1 Tax=Alicyclobacillus sp. TC TaxID=2606450 RepID=UPI0019338B0F|nr:Maf family protein [Alicyclobacillus sp. TC]QRF24106.1 septum formation protein Maf [Alicyclobacillus sp. TC]
MKNDSIRIHWLLGSSSQRRQAILDMLGQTYHIRPSHLDESFAKDYPPEKQVKLLAEAKAHAVYQQLQEEHFLIPTPNHQPWWIVTADTLVDLDGTAIGKPSDANEALATLMALSGRSHLVWTCIAIYDLKNQLLVSETDCAKVTFANIQREDFVRYIATGEPLDKAGAYAAQGMGAQFIEKVEGDFFTVMGLSPRVLWSLAKRIGYQAPLFSTFKS